ncbi:unnamed protein product [Rotaria sp. Silwood1]|nr:unnamed protein product [Rotaria sp. Silwood1]
MGLDIFYTMEQWANENGQPTMFDAVSTRFSVNDTIETLAYNMFIETWISNVSYEMFFNACEPKECTYTYHYRFDALEVLTTFLSIFGGLSVRLRFFVPHLFQVIQKIVNRFHIRPVK